MIDNDYVNLLDFQVRPETRQQIEDLAHRRGYASLEEYVRALIISDAFEHGERIKIDDEGDRMEDFRQGWKEV